MSIREIAASVCIILGILIFCCSILGVYRLKYVLNRIHAAALGDTLGLFLVVLGLFILGNGVFHMMKYVLVVLFFWISSPIATHMIAKVELLTDRNYEERMRGK